MSAQGNDLTFRLGEAFGPHTLAIVNADGTPTNLTGKTLTLVVRELDGATNLLSVAMAIEGSASGGKATLPAIPATGAQSVANLAAFVEQVLRYKVVDQNGGQLAAGWGYVAPQWGAV